MLVPDGIAKDQVLLVDQLVSRDGQWRASRIEAGARALRAVPGVRAVTPALGLPMKQTMMMTYDLKGPGGASVTARAFAAEGMLQSLGRALPHGSALVASHYTTLTLPPPN